MKTLNLLVLLIGLWAAWSGQARQIGDIDDLQAAADWFVTVDPYQVQPLERIEQSLSRILHGDPDSIFLPGAQLSPPTRALLTLEAAEKSVASARFRIRYGLIQVSTPPKAAPLTVSLVQVDRFNLAPARYQALVRAHGKAAVRVPDGIEVAHVSWRFAMRPVMGTVAMTADAARADIPEAFAETMDCLGVPCTAAQSSATATELDWQPGETPSLDFQADYAINKEQVPSPAAVLDLLLAASQAASRNDRVMWRGFEPREGVAPGAPFVDIVIETGLGQDSSISGLLRDDHLMDHEIRTQWLRLRAAATAPDQPPAMDLARAAVPWPRFPD